MIDAQEHQLLARSLEHAIRHHSGAALDAALADIGWHEALAADPRAAVSLLFERQGAAGTTSSAVDHVLAHALGRPGPAVLLPAIGRWEPPGTVADGRLRVRGLATAGWATRPSALVVAGRGDMHVAFEIEPDALPGRTLEGIDPALHLLAVDGEVQGAQDLGPVDWAATVAAGQLALGHELVGASRRMLELARQHAVDRIQFGQPIATFQAVRHRLADALVAIEAASAALDAAWIDGTPQLAAMAKATAGRAARLTAKHGQQVLAGVGFTTEHPFHRFVRRVYLLDQLYGATPVLTRELGRDILTHRRLPPLLAL